MKKGNDLRIRIRIRAAQKIRFLLIWIRIRISARNNVDRDPDSDPDPQHCFKDYVREKVFYNLVLLQDHGQDIQQGEQRIKKQDSLTKVKY